MQLVGVLLLVVIVIALPLYWVLEPTRQAGAKEQAADTLAGWGEDLFRPTAEGGFNCAGCHGGMNATGGNAPGTVTDPATGEVRAVTCIAPALNTVLYRFSPDEVRYILTYGRPGTPMSAWGLDGGGPMNAQQLDTLIAYLGTIQVPREDCQTEEADNQNCPTGHLPSERQQEIETLRPTRRRERRGRQLRRSALQPLPRRRRVQLRPLPHAGWSYGEPGVSGQGRLGWNLTGGATTATSRRNPDMIDFVSEGSVNGAGYGRGGQGSGRMPGFGALLTDEQIQAIVEYVRSL